MVLAVRYSLAFCIRHSRRETIGRIFTSMISTVLLYAVIQSVGAIINKVQIITPSLIKGSHTVGEFVQSGILKPLAYLVIVLLLGVVHARFSWFYKSRWNMILRHANLKELNDHRAKLDVACFNSKQYDDLEKRIQELPTSWQTRIWFSDEMLNLFSATVSFVLFGASLFWYKPMYAFVILVGSMPMMVAEFRMNALWWGLFERLTPHHKKRGMLEKPYHGKEAFTQALMFNQMPSLRKEIDKNTGKVLTEYDIIRRICMSREAPVHFLGTVALLGVIIHAVWTITNIGGAIGTLTVLISLARTFQGNLESIVNMVANQWNNAKGVILTEKEFFGLQPFVQTPSPVNPSFDGAPTIRFDKVSFAYPEKPDVEVLKDVSFTIIPGSKTAIVGKSGNGKSTIMHLIMRHYDPTSGAIFADNINLRQIEPRIWNNTASALTQDYSILNRRIGEEIGSSRLDEELDLERAVLSSTFANFDEVVDEDKDGYDSQIGTDFGGREFSGGEKQRLALARVHYRGTPIFIFDEPDARLDPESAEKVIKNVLGLVGVTVIIITHHVSRAELCDRVIVMGKGEVVEEGTHEDLILRDGMYARMFEKDLQRLGLD